MVNEEKLNSIIATITFANSCNKTKIDGTKPKQYSETMFITAPLFVSPTQPDWLVPRRIKRAV